MTRRLGHERRQCRIRLVDDVAKTTDKSPAKTTDKTTDKTWDGGPAKPGKPASLSELPFPDNLAAAATGDAPASRKN